MKTDDYDIHPRSKEGLDVPTLLPPLAPFLYSCSWLSMSVLFASVAESLTISVFRRVRSRKTHTYVITCTRGTPMESHLYTVHPYTPT
jgi:hypothetical protein